MAACAPRGVATAQDAPAAEPPADGAAVPPTDEGTAGATGVGEIPVADGDRAEGAPGPTDAATVEPAGDAGGASTTPTDGAGADATTAVTSTDASGPASSETPADAPARGSASGEGEADGDAEAADDGIVPGSSLSVQFDLGGTLQLRGVAMSDIPLMPGGPPIVPRGATIPAELGQNYWAEQWMRLRFTVSLSEGRTAAGAPIPILRLIGETDLFFGVGFGELAVGTRPAAWARDEYGYPGVRLRHLYLEWTSDVGILRVGQMGFTWGLGLVANDGETPPLFGDYRYGDLVRRVLFAARPFGASVPFNVAAAFDWVAWDLTADFDRPCLRQGVTGGTGMGGCGDLAFQGVLAAFFQENQNVLGGYVAYRTQHNYLQDYLDVFVGDLFGRWFFDEPSGGRIFVAAEGAVVVGSSSLTRTATRASTEVQQFLAAVQVGRRETHVDVVLEGGYASGDSNTEDGVERRGTMDPDHRIGLVLFPEVIAWQSARAAFLATSEDTFGRPSRGAELLPTNGGVSGAFYLNPTAVWRPWDFLEGRFGAVLGFASADVVDPYRQRAESRSVNYRGGDPSRRDYGLELDAAILLHGEIATGVELNGGIEGGVLFPGHAFDDATGRTMGEVGVARLRVGISF